MECIKRLEALGITRDHAIALRRIAMTLDRWHELECGDQFGNAVERDETTKLTYRTFDTGQNGKRGRTRIADRETGARKRLSEIMKNYPALGEYVQGDPRGASLYIIKRSDVPKNEEVDNYYHRGVAVYK